MSEIKFLKYDFWNLISKTYFLTFYFWFLEMDFWNHIFDFKIEFVKSYFWFQNWISEILFLISKIEFLKYFLWFLKLDFWNLVWGNQANADDCWQGGEGGLKSPKFSWRNMWTVPYSCGWTHIQLFYVERGAHHLLKWYDRKIMYQLSRSRNLLVLLLPNSTRTAPYAEETNPALTSATCSQGHRPANGQPLSDAEEPRLRIQRWFSIISRSALLAWTKMPIRLFVEKRAFPTEFPPPAMWSAPADCLSAPPATCWTVRCRLESTRRQPLSNAMPEIREFNYSEACRPTGAT